MADRRYFAFVCNPRRFDGLAAVANLSEMAWIVDKNITPKPGDRVLLWQAKGTGERRGVIAIGEVTRGVEDEPSPEEESAYWVAEDRDVSLPRVRFRLYHIPQLPMWEEDHPWLGDLNAARARGGTTFYVTREQWERVAGKLVAEDAGVEAGPPGSEHMPLEPFVPNRRYRRRTDLHGRYGGQTQGGISTPAGYPIILLFTGQTGEQYGYGQDGWDGDVFRYCGEGQRGDMEFRAGNKAIRDHVENGKALHLFKILGRGEVRHIGEFICAGWQEERGQDVDGNDRKLIVFSLAPAHAALDDIAPSDAAGIDELRARALAAPKLRDGDAATSSRRVYERSRDVRLYVLARAKGRCESCGAAAPFKRKRDGSPYLEPHHTKMIAEGGPDHPRWVAAVCPNCHSEIHFGEQGCEKNSALSAYLAQVES